MPTSDVTAARNARVASLDILRGVVMVLMAIDHVRVYAGVPAGGPTAALFLTRWITHFCAPVFVFLAGTSAYLQLGKLGDVRALARRLVVRGLWLILLELTVIRLAWAFNARLDEYMLAGVIWMLGWCMIALAALVFLPTRAVAIFGLAVVVGHNASAFLAPETVQGLLQGSAAWFFKILYFGGGLRIGSESPNFLVLYSIVPWVGVIALGYVFGRVVRMAPAQRDRWCYVIGLSAVALFIILRVTNVYGDRPWAPSERAPSWILFLGTSKYPASLQFLLMTLGPALALLPLMERMRGAVARWLTVFGRVPFFYYILHIPLIHLVALGIASVRTPDAVGWLFDHHPMRPADPPDGYRWSLSLLYAVTALCVVALYFPCRWFAAVKQRTDNFWTRYL